MPTTGRVLLAGPEQGGLATPWVLREDLRFDLEYDVERGWRVRPYGLDAGLAPSASST